MLDKIQFGLVIVYFALSFIYLLAPDTGDGASPGHCHTSTNEHG